MPDRHTPGPWYLKSWHESLIVTRDGDAIASVYADKNRKLIAFAPDLLADLQDLVDHCEAMGVLTQHKCLIRAKQTIAKAEGTSS